MNPRSILAITDFSARAGFALARAAQWACEHDATLKLLHADPEGEHPCPAAAACRLTHHAWQLGQRHGLRVQTVGQTANTLEDVAAEARDADLLVMSDTTQRGLQPLLRGQPVARLLRMTRRPILVVRQDAAAPYRRLMVAVDFSEASRKLVELAFALNKSAQVELFHALSTVNEGRLRYAEVPDHAIKAYRDACRRFAQDRMFRLSDSSDARRNRVRSAIGHGDPARQAVVQQQHSGAELIVVGKHPASAVSDFVFGSVAQRVLRFAGGDVLVVPLDFQAATRAAAVQRLDRERWATRRVRAGGPLSPG